MPKRDTRMPRIPIPLHIGQKALRATGREDMMCGLPGGIQMHVLRKLVIAAALAAFSISGAVSSRAGSPVFFEQNKNEAQATAALIKMGIPVHKDSQGIVRWIEAAEGELSDEAMRHLPALSKLEWLEIGGGKVTQSGAANLKGCIALKRLYIHDIDLTNDSFEWLENLTQLEALSLQRTKIDGRFLKNLKATETLAVLNLSGNQIVNNDLEQMVKFKGLEVLALKDTKITSAGIHKLEGMTRLNELNLMNCPVSDEDVPAFLTMPNLRIVYAEGCNIGDMAVMDMKTRFPMLAIFR
jgi:hypothetical protein